MHRKYGHILRSVFIVIVSSLFMASFVQAEIKVKTCLECHDGISQEAYAQSIHGQYTCTSCHMDIETIPHVEPPVKVDCAVCHSGEVEIYQSSGHGVAVNKGIKAATCLDCHGSPHTFLKSDNPESLTFRKNIPQTCAFCHEDEKKMEEFGLLKNHPVKSYSSTVHGRALAEDDDSLAAVCTDCHGNHDVYSPVNPKSKTFRKEIPSTCGECHGEILDEYKKSVHGVSALSGKIDAPVCTDCHGEHEIQSHLDPKSKVYSTKISEKVCGGCHGAERVTSKYHLPTDRLETYLGSYHGLANKFGVKAVANCASCHGSHNVLPSRDERSSVHKDNLSKTCGQCHPNAGSQLTQGSVHVAPSMMRDQAIFFVTIFYIFLIIVVVGGMLVHNFLDFLPKFKAHYRRYTKESPYLRFTVRERVQHLILALTFIILAYTGFALRHPNDWWASAFNFFGFGFDWRGVVHRAAAIVFCLLCVYHIYFIFGTKRGMGQLRALLMRKKDLTDMIQTIQHNLGLRKSKPLYGKYNYIEKMEYWALVWGAIIMIVTGAILTFENFTMTFLPKWILDVALTIHYYEAILATLAIIVWHLYFTIFDLSQYPLNLSMMTGRIPEEERRSEPKRKKKKEKE